ncbi:hypothetical protein [Legionella oakridgensis]|nr:hypothetical protein [Legionella oakridgensis]
MSHVKIWLGLLLLLMLSGCVSPPPKDVNNICSIFKEYPGWYADAKDVQRRWRVPIAVQMAIIHQESKFNGRARPERTKLLWIIPWTRPSTAYGYTQALRSTWENYQKTHGRLWASRDHFGDGVDFIGWYANIAHNKAGIRRDDTYSLYLAYHEGVGGYQRQTYLKKKWLMGVAHKVAARAQIYQAQLASCEASLNRKAWYKMW